MMIMMTMMTMMLMMVMMNIGQLVFKRLIFLQNTRAFAGDDDYDDDYDGDDDDVGDDNNHDEDAGDNDEKVSLCSLLPFPKTFSFSED